MDMPIVAIRPAGEADRSLLEDLIADCYATVYPGWYDAEVLENALPAMLRIDPALLSSGRYLVAFAGSVAAGCGGWSVATPGTGALSSGTGHIRHFATRPGMMGKGVGGAILERCVAEARAAGVSRLQCFSSLAAEGFYARHGFAKQQDVTVMIGEAAFPAVLMERLLA
ncbi:MAG: GNAT family N-acetyltransferase [Notoacmeibacter sp.]|nr:GNAT family N-acetyltransferase [Notoacmeibacter sp.]MCC0032233.1 GNAT family N-acetyltransferase [Brucellaceae bacterium]